MRGGDQLCRILVKGSARPTRRRPRRSDRSARDRSRDDSQNQPDDRPPRSLRPRAPVLLSRCQFGRHEGIPAARGRRKMAIRSMADRGRPGMPGRTLRRRYGFAGGFRAAGSDRARTATPERESLALLPSGPDAVRTLSVRGTRSVNTTYADPIPAKPPLGRRSVPLERISGSGNR